jgi:4-hydroxybenzoate polyprenyltransferase
MAMLNDRDRHVLNDLERQLQQEDPAWVRQFKDPKPQREARRDLRLGTAMGLLVLLTALCLLLDIPVGAVIFGSTVIVLAYVHYRR